MRSGKHWALFSALALLATLVPVGAAVAATEVTIAEIQGSGQFSPLVEDEVTTTGVVTAITADGRDLWIQDPVGDGDPLTSEGINVDDGARFSDAVVGDLVQVTATVTEQQFAPALPLTRLDGSVTVEILAGDQPLPEPVSIDDLPNESIAAAIAHWEPLEGMRVAVANAPVVGPTNSFGEFTVLTKTDAKPGSGFFPQTQQILLRSLGGEAVDYNPERVIVDDQTLTEAIIAKPGDRVRRLVGVLDYTFGNYKIQPTAYDVNTLPMSADGVVSTRSGPKGDFRVTTFNVENLFDTELNLPTVVDSFGRIGEDPGDEWSGGGIGTQNETLRRKADVCAGDADPTDAFDPSAQWDGYAQNTFDGLGSHSVTCGTTNGLIISEYVEGSSFNKAVEIYNGTGSAVNLGLIGGAIRAYHNGATTPNYTVPLSGILADGDVYVVAHPSANPAILAVADLTSGGIQFNGDDALTLSIGGKDDASSTLSPEELDLKLSKLAMAVETELELPDILVVQEVENTDVLQMLGDRVNASAGTAYSAVSFETSDARGIEVGFLWDANRVELLDAFQLSGPDVEAAFGASSPSPGREPLVGSFDTPMGEITIIGNHFKSKGGDDALFGVNDPPIRITETQRKAQAQVVRDFVDSILDSDPMAKVIVAGDLNDFQFSEPGEGPDNPLAILEGIGGGVPLENLIFWEKDAERFTYVFDGNSQVLDHVLVSPGLVSDVAAVDVLHFNASFPAAMADDGSTATGSSDHDPVEVRFK